MRLSLISLTTLLITSTFGLSYQANAQLRPETTTEAINKAFSENSGDIYHNSSLTRQFNLLFSIDMPEHQYMKDIGTMNRIYRQGMQQQGLGDGVIRTPDLPNPYNTSLYSNPSLSR
jgi:hypothetical protein